MTVRLQVLLPESELERLRVTARVNNVSVGEWVRRAIRRSFEETQPRSAEAKITAVREAMRLNAPTGDIDTINREIEQGYPIDLP